MARKGPSSRVAHSRTPSAPHPAELEAYGDQIVTDVKAATLR